MVVAASAVAALSSSLLGCDSDDDEAPASVETASDADGDLQRYALVDDDAWTLQEAADLAADDPVASLDRPVLDWYAEYLRRSDVDSDTLRVSGHPAAFETAITELEAVGFEFADVPVPGWRAVGGSHPHDSPSPTILVLEHGRTSLVLLSYELTLADLAAVATRVESVDAAAWIEAGGIIR